MESILNAPVRFGGVVARNRYGGQDMADTSTILVGVLGSGGLIGGIVLHLLSKGASERKALEEQTEARVREQKDARESDRQAFTSILQGFQQLKTEVESLKVAVSRLNIEVDGLRSIKQALESQVVVLQAKIAQDAVTLAAFEQNEVIFRVEIAELTQRLDQSHAEVTSLTERLVKIDADIKAGKFNPNTYYQEITKK